MWDWSRALTDMLDCQKNAHWIVEQIKPETLLQAKMTKEKLSYFRHIM